MPEDDDKKVKRGDVSLPDDEDLIEFVDPEITVLLNAWADGAPDALEELMPRVVGELRTTARRYFAQERSNHTLQPTALVNEVFVRLVGRRKVSWSNRAHFFGFAAQTMRHILVDHARRHRAQRRGGDDLRLVPLDEAFGVAATAQDEVDLLDLDTALKNLEEMDANACRVVELRYFAGLTLKEVASVTGMSVSTARRLWDFAKIWLFRELRGDSAP